VENQLKMKLVELQEKINFSGSIIVEKESEMKLTLSSGYANRADKLENKLNTRYGIASGCKIFTAISICQLVQSGKLGFDTKLKDCLDMDFPLWDNTITIHHLLTHTSGVPDYFDEEVMDDFEDLWKETPMYGLHRLSDFLVLFQNEKMKMKPGERFHYNNAGYILLGLVVEKISGKEFTAYVEEHIFQKAAMTDSGYFSFDALPERTAFGYIDKGNGTFRTNIYSLPIRGGSDGGAFVTAEDMLKMWKALMNNKLLNESLANKLLTPHVQVKAESYYGYGVWMQQSKDKISKYHVMGYDPGVNFRSAFYPNEGITFVACSNVESGTYEMMQAVESLWR